MSPTDDIVDNLVERAVPGQRARLRNRRLLLVGACHIHRHPRATAWRTTGGPGDRSLALVGVPFVNALVCRRQLVML